jgi:hypothetical protein
VIFLIGGDKLFLQHNAALTRHQLRTRNWQIYSPDLAPPDLAPLDYYLFPNLKKYLKGRKFLNIEEATLAVDGWLAAQPKEFFFDGLKKLEQWRHKCVCGAQGGVCRVNTFFQSCSLLFYL